MKTQKIKKCMSLFLAALRYHPVRGWSTAYAAEETDEVCPVSFYECPDSHIYDLLGVYESFWQAVIDLGENTGSVKDLINLTENMDCFDYLSGITNDSSLGYYWVKESGCYDTKAMGTLSNYIDYEGFGRDIRFVDIYNGKIENIPEEYRIQSPNLYVRAAIGRREKGMEH